MQLFDTHTHFDVADFDHDRQHLAVQAKQVGVEALVLIGFTESRFDELIQTHLVYILFILSNINRHIYNDWSRC